MEKNPRFGQGCLRTLVRGGPVCREAVFGPDPCWTESLYWGTAPCCAEAPCWMRPCWAKSLPWAEVQFWVRPHVGRGCICVKSLQVKDLLLVKAQCWVRPHVGQVGETPCWARLHAGQKPSWESQNPESQCWKRPHFGQGLMLDRNNAPYWAEVPC